MLVAIGDRVSFVTAKGPAFEADRAEIKVKWPRLELGGGVRLTVNGQLYRLSFVRPKGYPNFDETPRKELSKSALEALAGLNDITDLGTVVFDFLNVHRGRASGKDWKAYFDAGTAQAPAGPETSAAPG